MWWGFDFILTGYISDDIFTLYIDTLATFESSQSTPTCLPEGRVLPTHAVFDFILCIQSVVLDDARCLIRNRMFGVHR